jgi:hypothetical protein
VVRRDDGGEVYVQARCTKSAEEIARARDNIDALSVMREQASMLSISSAEAARPSKGRVLVDIWFDPLDGGNVRTNYEYPD